MAANAIGQSLAGDDDENGHDDTKYGDAGMIMRMTRRHSEQNRFNPCEIDQDDLSSG